MPALDWLAQAQKIVDRFPKFLDEFENLICRERNPDRADAERRASYRQSLRLAPELPARCFAPAA